MNRGAIRKAIMDFEKAGASCIALAGLYEAYAQLTLEESGVRIDLHELCGFRKFIG